MSPFVESLIILGAFYLLLAWSFHVVFVGNVLYFGQFTCQMVAAYLGSELAIHHMNWWLAGVVAVAASVATGLLLTALTIRLEQFALALVSNSVGIIFVLLLGDGTNFLGGSQGLAGIPGNPTWVDAIIFVVVAGISLFFFHRSILFRAATAAGSDRDAARTFGIRPNRIRFQLVIYSAILAGTTGCLYASYAHYIDPSNYSFDILNSVLVFAILGGIRSFVGPLIAVGVLWVLPEWYNTLGNYHLIAYSAILIVVVLVFPDGIGAIGTSVKNSLFNRRSTDP
jgi:branched-chain amino acid transport system permease protein